MSLEPFSVSSCLNLKIFTQGTFSQLRIKIKKCGVTFVDHDFSWLSIYLSPCFDPKRSSILSSETCKHSLDGQQSGTYVTKADPDDRTPAALGRTTKVWDTFAPAPISAHCTVCSPSTRSYNSEGKVESSTCRGSAHPGHSARTASRTTTFCALRVVSRMKVPNLSGISCRSISETHRHYSEFSIRPQSSPRSLQTPCNLKQETGFYVSCHKASTNS